MQGFQTSRANVPQRGKARRTAPVTSGERDGSHRPEICQIEGFDEAIRLGDHHLQAELAYRLRKAGRLVDPPDGDHPFALQARGDWQAAAQAWAAARLSLSSGRCPG